MNWGILKGLTVLHGIILLLGAWGGFVLWRRTRFWLPRYVHFLALFSFLIMLWGFDSASVDAPISKEGPVQKVLWTLSLPAFIYALFIMFGGHRAAFERRFGHKITCPHCSKSVKVILPVGRQKNESVPISDLRCPYCLELIPNPIHSADGQAQKV